MDMEIQLLWLMALFALKHFICDFPLQTSAYMYANKGSLRHPGGYLHAGIHGVGTVLCLWLLFPMAFVTAVAAGVVDFVIHYIVDYLKVNTNRHFNLRPDSSSMYWILLGYDQLMHHLTYIAIAAIFVVNG